MCKSFAYLQNGFPQNVLVCWSSLIDLKHANGENRLMRMEIVKVVLLQKHFKIEAILCIVEEDCWVTYNEVCAY